MSRNVLKKNHPTAWRDPVLVILAAVAMRIAAWLQLSRTPFFDAPVVDASTFNLWARAIADGATFPGTADVFFKPPLYPYLLAGVYGLFGPDPAAAYRLQMIAGVGICLLVLAIGRRVFDRPIALGAALITALLPVLPFFEAQLLAETWSTLLTLLALERLLPARDKAAAGPGMGRLAVAGLSLGIAALGRPNLMLLVVAIAAWAAWDGPIRRPRLWRRALVVLAAAAVAILPVTLRNLSVGGEPVLISANLGANLVTGHHDGADGVSAIPVGLLWDDLQLGCQQAGQGSAAASSRYLTGQALHWMAAHPGRTLTLLGRKLLVLVSGWEARNNIGTAWLAREHGVWLLHRWWPGTWLLLPVAIVGLVRLRRRPGVGLLLIAVAAQAVALLPFFVNARFRLPLLPLLALFAAAAVADTLGRLRVEGRAALAAPLAVLLVSAVVVNVDWLGLGDPRWNAEDAFNEALILQKTVKGRAADIAGSVRLLERAIELDPTFPDAHERLGVMNLMRGQQGLGLVERDLAGGDTAMARRRAAQTDAVLQTAAAACGEALALVPRSYRSQTNIGTALLLSGEMNAALARTALAAGDSVAALEDATTALDRYRQADLILDRALTLNPSFPEAVANRGILAGSILDLPPLSETIRSAQADLARR